MSRPVSITLAVVATVFALVSVLAWRVWQISTHPLSRPMSTKKSRKPR